MDHPDEAPADASDDLLPALRAGFGLAPSDSVLARLSPDGDPLPAVLLRDEPGASAPVVHPRGAAATGRYQVVGEIARGGVGVVLKGRDVDLGRDVAMKILREEYQANPDVVRRFVEEAQIGGQLQHPGIVPVYELGMGKDKRPYFTMKLIKGKTLASLLSERPSPGHDRVRFLRVFESVCHTVAYAHARGVIHRDLKPANVMVGSFGEVLVVDWGMGKVLRQGGVADEKKARANDQSVIATVRSESGGSPSIVGSVMGTPRYMPPEQARGDVERMDERSDVFALGAILCEVLTGETPYSSDSEEAFLQAARGEAGGAFERLDASGAEKDLVAIAKRCLSADPKSRPADAGAVAKAIGRHLASLEERARASAAAAEEARVVAREERRRKKVTIALFGAVFALVLGAGAFVWWNDRAERARADAVLAKVDEALREADRARERAAATTDPRMAFLVWRDALAAAAKAEVAASSGDATESIRKRVEASVADLKAGAEAARRAADDRVRDLKLNAALDEATWAFHAGKPWEQADASIGRLFREYGLDPEAPESTWTPVIDRCTIRSPLASAIDNWMTVRRKGKKPLDRLEALARAVDDSPWGARRRAAKSVDDLRRLADEMEGQGVGWPLAGVAIALVNLGDYERAGALAERLIQKYPAVYGIRMAAGDCARLSRPRNTRVAIQQYSAAIALQPDSLLATCFLGDVLVDADDPRTALAFVDGYRRAFGEHADLHAIRGFAYARLKQWDDAVDALRKTIAIDPDATWARAELGRALHERGESAEGFREVREAVRRNPDSAVARWMLGALLLETGTLDEAIEELRKAVAADPNSANAHGTLGSALRTSGALEEAKKEILEAIRLDPSLVNAHIEMCRVRIDAKEYAAAAESATTALGLAPRNHVAWNDVGRVHTLLGENEAAKSAFRQAASLGPESGVSSANLSNLLKQEGDAKGALETADEAVRREPGYAPGHGARAAALIALDRFDEAIDALAAQASAAPNDPGPRIALVHMLLGSGRLAEARDAVAVAVKVAAGGPYEATAEAYRRKVEFYANAEADLLAVLDGTRKPANAGERAAAAKLALCRRRYATSATQYARAFDEDKTLLASVPAVYDAFCAAARASGGAGEEAKGLDAKARSAFREKALLWGRASLALQEKAVADGAPGAQRELLHWRFDPDLACVRDPAALAALGEEERAAWWALWGDHGLVAGTYREGMSRRAEQSEPYESR